MAGVLQTKSMLGLLQLGYRSTAAAKALRRSPILLNIGQIRRYPLLELNPFRRLHVQLVPDAVFDERRIGQADSILPVQPPECRIRLQASHASCGRIPNPFNCPDDGLPEIRLLGLMVVSAFKCTAMWPRPDSKRQWQTAPGYRIDNHRSETMQGFRSCTGAASGPEGLTRNDTQQKGAPKAPLSIWHVAALTSCRPFRPCQEASARCFSAPASPQPWLPS